MPAPRSSSRKSTTPVPKEHGAWFMLAHCVLIGALVSGSFGVPVVLVGGASFFLFMAMQGLQQLARAYWRRDHGVPFRVPWPSLAFALAGGVLVAVVFFVWNLTVLLYWGAIAGTLIALYAAVVFQRKERSVLGEWLGILGLTLSAGMVWSAGTGRWGKQGLLLWALTLLYFGGSVPYVRLRVKQMKEKASLPKSRETRNALAYTGLALVVVSVLAVAHQIPALAVVPFLLSIAKVGWAVGGAQVPRRIAHIGYSEAVLSTVFALLTIVAFWPAR